MTAGSTASGVGAHAAPILACRGIGLSFGSVRALTDMTFDVARGEIVSIIGPNGAGKTSVINTITGFYRPTEGNIRFKGEDITGLPPHRVARKGIARTFQNTELFAGLTVLDNLLAARHVFLKSNILSCAVYLGFAQREDIQARQVVEDIIDLLEMEAIRKQEVGTLPYGQRKRVELGRALALEPEILLLDEPTVGMNLEEKEDMVRFILDVSEERGTTIVLVEHDMDIVMDISDRIIVFDFGAKIAEGEPAEIKRNARVIQAYLGDG
ncbi:MAG TPA: ABC transporter ATP-binding protein [Anaeromyxobacteraceae bacterium]|nr:ABC transporter ATP-binding protein [Anaeromyxobacteraceae bacterium]